MECAIMKFAVPIDISVSNCGSPKARSIVQAMGWNRSFRFAQKLMSKIGHSLLRHQEDLWARKRLKNDRSVFCSRHCGDAHCFRFDGCHAHCVTSLARGRINLPASGFHLRREISETSNEKLYQLLSQGEADHLRPELKFQNSMVDAVGKEEPHVVDEGRRLVRHFRLLKLRFEFICQVIVARVAAIGKDGCFA